MEFVFFIVIFPVFLAILSARTTSALALQENNGQQLHAAPHPDDTMRLSWNRAAGAKNPARMWPNAMVPYTISADIDEDQIKVLRSAMDLITQKSCITFKERTNETDYVSIETGYGCAANIGRVGGYQQLLLKSPGCGEYAGKVAHELLHVLGLIHEQSRPDRNRYVEIVMQNIQDKAKHDFQQYNWNQVQNLSVPYDLNSLMHYGSYAFTKNGGVTLIAKKKGTYIPTLVNDLSPGDTAFINFMYCNTTTTV